MYSFGKGSYNRRNDYENKYESSLSNVYRDLMSANKDNPIILQYDSKNSNNNNIPKNYHFLNTNRPQYKAMSPQPQNSQNYNRLSYNSSKNFYDNQGLEKNDNNKDYSYQKENIRNKSYDPNRNNNLNKSSGNIFSNNNYSNNISSFSKKNFYDTLTSFGKEDYSNKINNSGLFNNSDKENYRKNNNYSTSTYKPDIIYKNFFNYNQNTNNDYSNSRSNQDFISKPSESISARQSYENKNKFFSNNNYDSPNYNPIKNLNYENTPTKLAKGYSLDNIHSKNLYPNKKNLISNYSSSTMAGTNGYGITKTNQDSFIIKVDKNNNNENEYTLGVFDGHGAEGHLVSQAIKQFFTNCSYFDYHNKSMIVPLFASLSKIINNSTYFDSIGSGSTVVLIHITQEKIISMNCGDSRAILITKKQNIVPLSRDHKPELPEERTRIEASGGRVDKIYGMGPYRVWFKNEDYPGLAMSRSIGDKLAHKVGVSDIPEIKEFNIEDLAPLAIIVASDGIWEFMPNEDVKNIVMNYSYSKDANLCSKKLVEKARLIWQGTGYAIDDITCIVAFFE